MKILILGGDGYLGWPTALHFSKRGDEVCIVDNFAKRRIELENGIEPLLPIPSLHRRNDIWRESSGNQIDIKVGDLQNHRFVYRLLEEFKPEVIVHYAEQPSAPYSMLSREAAHYTQVNNVVGTLNLMFAMQAHCPDCHLVKLGTMGEYGTPNIDIEEGWLELVHNGRSDRVLYPKKPHSFYHLSKVHDSHNLEFGCRVWGMRVTDLNQGVVYGLGTDETSSIEGLHTSFHYDDIFGTALNRFLVQASVGTPLTVYGSGSQTRGFLNIIDTIRCIEIAADNPAPVGEFRVFNQFTEVFSIAGLAEKVAQAGIRAGLNTTVQNLTNPRVEQEDHYYKAKNTNLIDLGLEPHFLTDDRLDIMLDNVLKSDANIETSFFSPRAKWRL